jgi:hypothetical protein
MLKSIMRSYFLGLMIIFGTAPITTHAQAAYSFPSLFDDIHTVYRYTKSNWDGSNASGIYLYVKDSFHLESFKWTEGDEWATVVEAEIDWENAAVKRFTNHRLYAGGERKKIAELTVSEAVRLSFRVGDFKDSMILDSRYWHSYDFDFAGLGFTWRALKDKKAEFSFLIADAAMVNGKPGFANKGMANVRYENDEKIREKICHKYSINGPGLANRGGYIWIDPVTWMIEEYRIDLPDEDGYDNGRLKLVNIFRMEPGQWETFKIQKSAKK